MIPVGSDKANNTRASGNEIRIIAVMPIVRTNPIPQSMGTS